MAPWIHQRRSNISSQPVIAFHGSKYILYLLYTLAVMMLSCNISFFWRTRRKYPDIPMATIPTMTTATTADREYVLGIFEEAGITLDDEAMEELPSWSHIKDYIGQKPIIYGLDSCSTFQNRIPAVERNLGCSGMFNSGTNLLTQLLKENCRIPERVAKYGIEATREAHGIRWQVPWGKHTHAKYREEHSTEKAKLIQKESVLPVVTIRNPYHWMTTMCQHPYSAKWGNHQLLCPHLVDLQQNYIPLKVKYADNRVDHHLSLAHLWNDWYKYYFDTTLYPRIIVRFEDLIFHAKNLTYQICSCAGGEIRTDRPFQYIVDSAKDGPGHGTVRTGMVAAWIKYGKPLGPLAGYTRTDWDAAQRFLDPELMTTFDYKHPPGI